MDHLRANDDIHDSTTSTSSGHNRVDNHATSRTSHPDIYIGNAEGVLLYEFETECIDWN